MRKLLIATAFVAVAGGSSIAEETPIKCSLCFVEDVRVAFDAIRQCEEEQGSWHCKELVEQLLGAIEEKYNLGT